VCDIKGNYKDSVIRGGGGGKREAITTTTTTTRYK